MTAADSLVLNALNELAFEATVTPARTATLDSTLEGIAARRLASGLDRWRTFIAVSAALQPVEDELYSTQRALRRAHASLVALQKQQA